jgi:hypothetical protein
MKADHIAAFTFLILFCAIPFGLAENIVARKSGDVIKRDLMNAISIAEKLRITRVAYEREIDAILYETGSQKGKSWLCGLFSESVFSLLASDEPMFSSSTKMELETIKADQLKFKLTIVGLDHCIVDIPTYGVYLVSFPEHPKDSKTSAQKSLLELRIHAELELGVKEGIWSKSAPKK